MMRDDFMAYETVSVGDGDAKHRSNGNHQPVRIAPPHVSLTKSHSQWRSHTRLFSRFMPSFHHEIPRETMMLN